MNQNKQWNTFFAVEKNICYETHMQNTKELSQICLKESSKRRRPSLSFGALMRKQLRFLAWKIWFLQGMALAVLYALFLCLYTADFTEWLFLALPKYLYCCSGIIVMCAIPILQRSSRCRMMELEQSTRFSAAGSLAAQLLFIGTGDLGMLAILAFTVAQHGMTGSVIYLSLMIPFLTTAVTCLMLWSHTPSSVFDKSAVPLCIMTTLLTSRIIDQYRQFYFDGGLTGWILYSLGCLGILCREYRRLRCTSCRSVTVRIPGPLR